MQKVYPEHNWMLWKFKGVPKGFWDSKDNQKNFMDWLYIQLGFKSMQDWYALSIDDLKRHGGNGILLYYRNSPSKVLQYIYPDQYNGL